MIFNVFNIVQVTRHTPPSDSAILAEQYQDLGLPFYYYMPNLSKLMIIAGVILLIFQIFWFCGWIIILFQRKKYKCLNCKKVFYRRKPPKKCDFCGGEVTLD